MQHQEILQNPELFTNAREQRSVFFLVFMGVFSLTYGFFYTIDFLPEKPGTNAVAEKIDEVAPLTSESPNINETPTPTVTEEPVVIDPYPVRIIFDSLGREVPILNPESSDVAALDKALLEGVVRHPDSADFSDAGTIFLLGHSSYLPNVINKNFQAFNGIQKLEWGDTIRLRSSEKEYVYRVDRVYETRATEAEIEIERGKSKLTLATCNSFGTKDDRFIVEATLLETREL